MMQKSSIRIAIPDEFKADMSYLDAVYMRIVRGMLEHGITSFRVGIRDIPEELDPIVFAEEE